MLYNGNYNRHSQIAYNVFYDALVQTENELEEKWNINFALSDSEFSKVGGILLDEIMDKYKNSDSIESFISDETMNEVRRNVGDALRDDFENNKTKYNVSEETFSNLKNDAIEIFDRNFDNVIGNVSKLDVEEDLKELLQEWNIAYANLDYNTMNEKADKIDELYNGQYLYKDKTLNIDAKYVLIKNEYINKNIEKGNDGKLSELEEELFEQIKNEDIKIFS